MADSATILTDVIQTEKHIRNLLNRMNRITSTDDECRAQKFVLNEMIRFLVEDAERRIGIFMQNQDDEVRALVDYDVSLRFPLFARLKNTLQ